MKNLTKIEKEVSGLYSSFPFPNVVINKKEELYKTIIFQTVYFLSQEFLKNYKTKKIKILDAGCGTGELSLGLAGKDREILAVDRNKKSLEIAIKRAQKFRIKNVTFKEFDLARNKLPENTFDFVFSIGVIHHIPNTEKIFEKLVKYAKPGGYIVIGLYNPYGMMRKRIERAILKLLAGDDIKKRLELAEKLFYRKPLLGNKKIWAADTYAHPLQQHFSVEKVLEWFKKSNVSYISCEPPVEPTKNVRLIFQILKYILQRRKINLVNVWQETLINQSSKKWETSKPVTLSTQFVWMLIGAIFGRGEFYNIIGKKYEDK